MSRHRTPLLIWKAVVIGHVRQLSSHNDVNVFQHFWQFIFHFALRWCFHPACSEHVKRALKHCPGAMSTTCYFQADTRHRKDARCLISFSKIKTASTSATRIMFKSFTSTSNPKLQPHFSWWSRWWSETSPIYTIVIRIPGLWFYFVRAFP